MDLSTNLKTIRQFVCKNKHDEIIFDNVFNIVVSKPLVSDNTDSIIEKHKFVNHIKQIAFKLLQKYIEEPDHLLITRWFYTQKLLDHNPDLLLPYNDTPNEGIRYELTKRNVSLENIINFENLLHQMIMSYGVVNSENPMKKLKSSKEISVNNKLDIRIINNSYIALTYKNFSTKLLLKPYLKLINDYYKFMGLDNNIIINKGLSNKNLTSDELLDVIDEIVHVRIFNLMCRYQTLYAPGYHAAIPLEVFDVLRKYLKVNHEIFASPLNRTLDNYTSVFPDTDIFFGSQGNFFNEYPRLFRNGGSFEANPPFVEEHMAAFALIVIDALTKYTAALSFFIIVPAWTDTVLYHILTQSKFNVLHGKYIPLERHKHYYRNGSNYLYQDEVYKANNKSLIFILQNDSGKVKYPVTSEFITNLHKSFVV
jgi:hypothetical protein